MSKNEVMGFTPDEYETYLATAVTFLLEGGEREEAIMLLACEIGTMSVQEEYWEGDYQGESFYVTLRAPRHVYSALKEPENKYQDAINAAFQAIFPQIDLRLDVAVKLVKADPDWRAQVLVETKETSFNNQNHITEKPLIYTGMRFNSEPEIAIAKALDKVGVMYLPNCLVRVGVPNGRLNRFPDFLVCYKGKWGILEVDGKGSHMGRRTEDHERSRAIEQHGGIDYFTAFDAVQCMKNPEKVVEEFLNILGNKP